MKGEVLPTVRIWQDCIWLWEAHLKHQKLMKLIFCNLVF